MREDIGDKSCLLLSFGRWTERVERNEIAGTSNFANSCLVRISNDPGYTGDLADLLRRALCVTPRHQNLARRILAMDAAYGRAGILIGGSRNRTGIQDNKRSLALMARSLEAAHQQVALNGGAVSLGSATPKVFYKETTHQKIIRVEMSDLRSMVV